VKEITACRASPVGAASGSCPSTQLIEGRKAEPGNHQHTRSSNFPHPPLRAVEFPRIFSSTFLSNSHIPLNGLRAQSQNWAARGVIREGKRYGDVRGDDDERGRHEDEYSIRDHPRRDLLRREKDPERTQFGRRFLSSSCPTRPATTEGYHPYITTLLTCILYCRTRPAASRTERASVPSVSPWSTSPPPLHHFASLCIISEPAPKRPIAPQPPCSKTFTSRIPPTDSAQVMHATAPSFLRISPSYHYKTNPFRLPTPPHGLHSVNTL
jgi:hypothetical protein